MNQTNQRGRDNYKTKESFAQMFYHSCLGKFVIVAAVLLVLLIIAFFTAPKESVMADEMMDNIVQCIAENDSIKTDDLDDTVNNIGFIFTTADPAAVDTSLINAFYKYNRLECKRHAFHTTARVFNNFRPDGHLAGIGIFGIIIPTVHFSDLILRVDPIHKGYGNKLINNNSNTSGEYVGSQPPIQEYHYKHDPRD
jgi:hypothetical protein